MFEELKEIEDFVKRKFLTAVLDEVKEDERVGEWHVTDIVYDCLRRGYFAMKDRSYRGTNEVDLLYVWIGKKLHETDVSNIHELSMEEKGIKGKLDEVFILGNRVIIIDKKTTRKPIREPYEHHVKQVSFYAYMFKKLLERSWQEQLPKDVSVSNLRLFGALLYIDVDSGSSTVFAFPIDINKAEEEFLRKAELVKIFSEKNIVPPARRSWLCSYCNYLVDCLEVDRDVG